MVVRMPYDDICEGLHRVLAHSRYSVNVTAVTLITLSFTRHVELPGEEIRNWDPVRSQTTDEGTEPTARNHQILWALDRLTPCLGTGTLGCSRSAWVLLRTQRGSGRVTERLLTSLPGVRKVPCSLAVNKAASSRGQPQGRYSTAHRKRPQADRSLPVCC